MIGLTKKTENQDAFETFDNLNTDQQFYHLFHYRVLRVILEKKTVKSKRSSWPYGRDKIYKLYYGVNIALFANLIF